jgi:hypothetical protein
MESNKKYVNKIQQIRNTLENEILWIRQVFFKDVLSNKRLKDVVDEYNMPLLKIWYKEIGKEIRNPNLLNKTDAAIWELNRLNKETKEIEKHNIEFVMERTKCPKEIVVEIMRSMNIIYKFCGKKQFDPSDSEYIRQYCNIYLADIAYNTNELQNRFMVPINEVVELVKKDININ